MNIKKINSDEKRDPTNIEEYINRDINLEGEIDSNKKIEVDKNRDIQRYIGPDE